MQDAKRKGRTSRGSRRSQAKLDEEKVRLILASSESQYALAKRFGVARTTIQHVKRGDNWTHVTQIELDLAGMTPEQQRKALVDAAMASENVAVRIVN